MQQDAAPPDRVPDTTVPPQEDATIVTACPTVAAGGGKLCLQTSECGAGLECAVTGVEVLDGGYKSNTGSCWPICNESTTCADTTLEQCTGIDENATSGFCFPLGTFSGNWNNIPTFGEDSTDLAFGGTFNMQLQVCNVTGNVKPVSGTELGKAVAVYYAELTTGGTGGWVIEGFGDVKNGKAWDIMILILNDGFNTEAHDLASDPNMVVWFRQYSETALVETATSSGGTLTLTGTLPTAPEPTGTSTAVSGNVADGALYLWQQEICGSNTKPCQ